MVICTPPKPLTMAHTGRSTPCGTSGCRMPLTAAGNTPGVLAGVCSTTRLTRISALATASATTACWTASATPNWRRRSMPVRVMLTRFWRSVPPWTSAITPPGSWARHTFSAMPSRSSCTKTMCSSPPCAKASGQHCRIRPLWWTIPSVSCWKRRSTFPPPRQPLCGTACWPPGNMA